jgi:hypothetical protein
MLRTAGVSLESKQVNVSMRGEVAQVEPGVLVPPTHRERSLG